MSNVKKILLSVPALFLIISTLSGNDDGVNDAARKEEMRINVEEELSEKQREVRRKLVEEAFGAVDETRNALKALENENADKALEALEKVIGKLELILARENSLSLIPVDANVETVYLTPDLASDIDRIREIKSEAQDLMRKGYLPSARRLLEMLSNEIRINTVYLPIETYPEAIKEAVRLIDENKIDEARQAISGVLATLVVTEQSIPIPLLNTQVLLEKASDIINEYKNPEDIKEEKKEEILTALKDARDQLRLAEELGYGRRSREFQELVKDIEEIEEKVQKNKEAKGLFGKLMSRLNIFKEDISREKKRAGK